MMRRALLTILSVVCTVAGMLATAVLHTAWGAVFDKPGFIVFAPDRGFMGNGEVREVYQIFQATMAPHPTELVFASRGTFGQHLEKAASELREQGVTSLVILPLFFSDGEQAVQQLHERVKQQTPDLLNSASNGRRTVPVYVARGLAASYLVEQILEDRVRELSRSPGEERLVVLGRGTFDERAVPSVRARLLDIGERVRRRLGFRALMAGVLRGRPDGGGIANLDSLLSAIRDSAAAGETLVVVPFFIDFKMTPMMCLENMLKHRGLAHERIRYDGRSILPHPNVTRWLIKSATSYLLPTPESVGVVIMNHGSFFDANERMRQVVAPLAREFKVEFAMSMADPYLLQQAVSRLETRGVRHVVVLRVFSMTSSFKAKTEYILGLSDAYAERDANRNPPDRVRSQVVFYTHGGVEDHPLFAEVLLQRAQSVSQRPSNETVILVAHGKGRDDEDLYWRRVLRSLGAQMQSLAPEPFAAISAATWREDWPDKHEQAAQEVRSLIQQGHRMGRRVIVLAARLEGSGPGAGLLADLPCVYVGEGFSGHPNFTRWMREQIEHAITEMRRQVVARYGTGS